MIYFEKKQLHTLLVFLDEELRKNVDNGNLLQMKKLIYYAIFYGSVESKASDVAAGNST